MTLKQYKDDFKASFKWSDAISIGKIDNNQEKAICFYNSKRTLAPIKGIDKSSYSIKPITILLRYTKNQNTAEEKIQQIYEFLDERTFYIEDKRIYTQHLYSEAVNLGTDDKGVYEYSIEVNVLIER